MRNSHMKDIVIIGAGGFGREIAWLIEDINIDNPEWNIIGFVDENQSLNGTVINGYKVVGNIEWLKERDLYAIVAIGNPISKKKIIDELSGSKIKYATLIHPSVIHSKSVNFGEGTIICAGTICTVNIEIGSHVIINLDCTVGHDTIIGPFTTILPSVNVSGFVKINECVSIGTGTAIIQGVKIGRNTIVGAGAVIVTELPSNCTAVGIPAKPIKYHN